MIGCQRSCCAADALRGPLREGGEGPVYARHCRRRRQPGPRGAAPKCGAFLAEEAATTDAGAPAVAATEARLSRPFELVSSHNLDVTTRRPSVIGRKQWGIRRNSTSLWGGGSRCGRDGLLIGEPYSGSCCGLGQGRRHPQPQSVKARLTFYLNH